MNCKLPWSYSLPVRLAFLSPDVSTLRIGNWSGMQYTLADFFRLKQLISKENILLKILWPAMVKIFQTGPIPSDLKFYLAEIISKIFRKTHTDWLVESVISFAFFRHVSIILEEKGSLKKSSCLINNEISFFSYSCIYLIVLQFLGWFTSYRSCSHWRLGFANCWLSQHWQHFLVTHRKLVLKSLFCISKEWIQEKYGNGRNLHAILERALIPNLEFRNSTLKSILFSIQFRVTGDKSLLQANQKNNF